MKIELTTNDSFSRAEVTYRVRSKARSWSVLGLTRSQALSRALGVLRKNGHSGKRVHVRVEDDDHIFVVPARKAKDRARAKVND